MALARAIASSAMIIRTYDEFLLISLTVAAERNVDVVYYLHFTIDGPGETRVSDVERTRYEEHETILFALRPSPFALRPSFTVHRPPPYPSSHGPPYQRPIDNRTESYIPYYEPTNVLFIVYASVVTVQIQMHIL